MVAFVDFEVMAELFKPESVVDRVSVSGGRSSYNTSGGCTNSLLPSGGPGSFYLKRKKKTHGDLHIRQIIPGCSGEYIAKSRGMRLATMPKFPVVELTKSTIKSYGVFEAGKHTGHLMTVDINKGSPKPSDDTIVEVLSNDTNSVTLASEVSMTQVTKVGNFCQGVIQVDNLNILDTYVVTDGILIVHEGDFTYNDVKSFKLNISKNSPVKPTLKAGAIEFVQSNKKDIDNTGITTQKLYCIDCKATGESVP